MVTMCSLLLSCSYTLKKQNRVQAPNAALVHQHLQKAQELVSLHINPFFFVLVGDSNWHTKSNREIPPKIAPSPHYYSVSGEQSKNSLVREAGGHGCPAFVCDSPQGVDSVCRKGANQVRLLTHGPLKTPGDVTMLARAGWETQDYRIRDLRAPVKSRW